MEREQVVERMKALHEQAEAAHNMVQAISGAMQDCEYWLAVMDEDTATVEEDDYTNHERVVPSGVGEVPAPTVLEDYYPSVFDDVAEEWLDSDPEDYSDYPEDH